MECAPSSSTADATHVEEEEEEEEEEELYLRLETRGRPAGITMFASPLDRRLCARRMMECAPRHT